MPASSQIAYLSCLLQNALGPSIHVGLPHGAGHDVEDRLLLGRARWPSGNGRREKLQFLPPRIDSRLKGKIDAEREIGSQHRHRRAGAAAEA